MIDITNLYRSPDREIEEWIDYLSGESLDDPEDLLDWICEYGEDLFAELLMLRKELGLSVEEKEGLPDSDSLIGKTSSDTITYIQDINGND